MDWLTGQILDIVKLNMTITAYNTFQIQLDQFSESLRKHYLDFKDRGFWVHPKFRYEEFKWRSEYLR